MKYNICENFYIPPPDFNVPNRPYTYGDGVKFLPRNTSVPDPLLQKIKNAFNDPAGPGVMITCNPMDYPTGPIYMDGSATVLRGDSTWELFNPSGKQVQFGFFWDPSNNQALVSCGWPNDAGSAFRIDCAVPPSGSDCSKEGIPDRCGYCAKYGAGIPIMCGQNSLIPTLCKPPSTPAPWPNPDNNCVQNIMKKIPSDRSGINEFVFLPEYEAKSPPPSGPYPVKMPIEVDKVLQMIKDDNIPSPAGIVFIYDIVLRTGPTKVLKYADTQAIIQKYVTYFGNPPPKVLVIEMDTQAYKDDRTSKFPPQFKALIPITQLISYLQTLTDINESYQPIIPTNMCSQYETAADGVRSMRKRTDSCNEIWATNPWYRPHHSGEAYSQYKILSKEDAKRQCSMLYEDPWYWHNSVCDGDPELNANGLWYCKSGTSCFGK